MIAIENVSIGRGKLLCFAVLLPSNVFCKVYRFDET